MCVPGGRRKGLASSLHSSLGDNAFHVPRPFLDFIQFWGQFLKKRGRYRFYRFDSDMVRYSGFDIASILRAQSPCWSRCSHPATRSRKRLVLKSVSVTGRAARRRHRRREAASLALAEGGGGDRTGTGTTRGTPIPLNRIC